MSYTSTPGLITPGLFWPGADDVPDVIQAADTGTLVDTATRTPPDPVTTNNLLAIPDLAQPGAFWPNSASGGGIPASDSGTFTDTAIAFSGPFDTAAAVDSATVVARIPVADSFHGFDAGTAGINGVLIGPRVFTVGADLRTFLPDIDGQINL